MMISVGRTLPFALSVFAVLLLTGVAAQGQAADAPSDYDCETAWTSSSASDSCAEDNSTYGVKAMKASVDTSSYEVVASNNECSVRVDCLKSDTSVPR